MLIQCPRVSVVTITTDFPALIFPEDKVNKSSETPRRTKGTNTKFPNHIEYIYSTTSKKMPAEFGGEKTSTARKTTESILLFTQEEGIQRDNNESERNAESAERKTEWGKEREREDSFTGSAKQWSNITKYSINNIHKDPRLRTDLCQKFSANALCF